MQGKWYQLSSSINIIEKNRDFQKMNKKKADYKTPDHASEKPALKGESADIVEISADWTEKADWKAMAGHVLNTLKKWFPSINITVEASENAGSREEHIRRLALQAGDGLHLFVSKGFFDHMSSGAEAFERCRSILEDICGQISTKPDGVRSFGVYLTEKGTRYFAVPEEKKHKEDASIFTIAAEKNKKSDNHIRLSAGSANYDVAGKYMKMAQALNKSQVRQVLSEVNQSISSLRLVACLGEDEEKGKAAMIIRALQKLIQRGRKKIKRMDEEKILQLREKKAMEQQLEKKARLMRQELEKKRRKRYSEDHQMIEEGKLEDWKINRAKQQADMAGSRLQMAEASAAAGMQTGPGGGIDSMGGEMAAVFVSDEIMV